MGTNASLYAVQDEKWILHRPVGTKDENKAWIGTDEKPPRVEVDQGQHVAASAFHTINHSVMRTSETFRSL